jgi:acyl-CoA thioesterase I
MNFKCRLAPASLCALFMLCIIAIPIHTVRHEQSPEVAARPASFDASEPMIRVMSIGGSVAHGWKDTYGPGYLKRAFDALSEEMNLNFEYFDKTIVGANSTQLASLYKGKYQQWLRSIQPHIVVISWGLLNDAKDNVPLESFERKLQHEINVALNKGAQVFVVTPPVTKATYTQYQVQEKQYVNSEIKVVKSYRNENVFIFDVFHQMKSYIRKHHQTYVQYEGDGWHPNTPGHELAGQILYQDILKRVRQGEIQMPF